MSITTTVTQPPRFLTRIEARGTSVSVGMPSGSVQVTQVTPGLRGPKGDTGPQGPQGPPGTVAGAFMIANRLSELPDQTAKEEAQANLGLGLVDPVAYYILAKS